MFTKCKLVARLRQTVLCLVLPICVHGLALPFVTFLQQETVILGIAAATLPMIHSPSTAQVLLFSTERGNAWWLVCAYTSYARHIFFFCTAVYKNSIPAYSISFTATTEEPAFNANIKCTVQGVQGIPSVHRSAGFF
jgi:hypothetical protein